MTWLINRLRVPASEGHMGIVLAMCAVSLGLMSIALVWQAQVIANQRAMIEFLKHELGG